MKTRRIHLFIVLLTVAGLILAGCAKGPKSGSEGTPYKIGFCAAITGGGSSLGVPERDTAEMLAAQYADGVTGSDGVHHALGGARMVKVWGFNNGSRSIICVGTERSIDQRVRAGAAMLL